jgi:broad specificity phosphatase PhoE
VSDVVRLTLVAHAMTDAMVAGRFPADELLNAVGRRQLAPEVEVGTADLAITAPERRARQTAELLGLPAEVDDRLADLDFGRWRGGALGGVPAAELASWLTDPGRTPHGGESVVELVGRVRDWLAAVSARPGRVVAVTHPAVIRAAILAALDAPPKSFWRIDIAPASRTVLHFRGQAWTLRSGFGQR